MFINNIFHTVGLMYWYLALCEINLSKVMNANPRCNQCLDAENAEDMYMT